MKSILAALRRAIGRWVLRGRVLDWWLRRKTARLVVMYHELLVRSLSQNQGVRATSPIAGPAAPLRRLLVVCDNMWERRELLPELSSICDVTFVDVHPLVQPHAGQTPEHLPPGRIVSEMEHFRGTSFDCMLVYLRSTLLSGEMTEFLRRNWKCPLVGLNLDCKTTFADYGIHRREAYGYHRWAGQFDCNLTNARAMVDVYAAAGHRCLYIPTGYHFDPAIHRPPTSAAFEMKISFVGSCKPERRLVIEHLARLGIPVEVFGGGWGDRPFIQDAWRVYPRTQINLGIGYNVPGPRITNLKNRDFECPGAGGCYLTTYDWELAGLFEIGKEILCYRSMDDLVELYRYYAPRPEECLRIAAAGFERCQREHTWEKRFRRVFRELGFSL